MRTTVEKTIDQSRRETVAAADAIDETHHVALALVQRFSGAVPQKSAPAIVAGGQALAQGDGHQRWTEVSRDPLGRVAIPRDVERAGCDVCSLDVHAQYGLQVFFVRDHHVHVAHQWTHRRLRLGFGPELLAVVEIDADPCACALRSRHGGLRRGSAFLAKRGRDAGHVEPRGALHHAIPCNRVGRHLTDRGMGAIVDDGRCALACARLREIDAEAIAAADDEIRPDAFGAQGAQSGLADRVRRESRHVLTLEAELRKADRDVCFAAAERRRQHRRLKEPLEPRRTEPKHQLAERDNLLRLVRVGCHFADLAAATFATMRRAFCAITSNRPLSIAAASRSADPTPTATAPARIQSPALSRVTPPVGISLTCGSGARTSLMYCGPSAVAGNTLMMSAPASCASRISVGVKQPGATATPRSWHAWMTSRRNTGLTTYRAPASTTALTVAASVTVPAPRMKPSGMVGASSRMRATAFGTVIVTSSARTPPSASASTTPRSFPGSRMRMTATMPKSWIARTTASRDSRLVLCVGILVDRNRIASRRAAL